MPLETKHHSLQARMSKDDPRLYNVNRDLAHCFSNVARMVAGRLEDKLWPELEDVLRNEGVSMEDLGKACEAYCKFLVSSVENPEDDMAEVMRKCGWFEVPPPARIAYLATMGTVVGGLAFAGIREATLQGEGPVQSMGDLMAAGERCSRLMSQPRWKIRLSGIWGRVSRAFNILRNKD